MEGCTLCPRNCRVNRENNEKGFCGETAELRIARAAPHFWEEPCLSGTQGSGTVFFTGCNLRCCFCQNRNISRGGHGKPVSNERLTEIFFELAEKGVHNINLVTPTHFIPQIREAILRARARGLTLPFAANCGGYENPDTLHLLDGLIDIYLTDMKFYSPEVSAKLCGVRDYFPTAKRALSEMERQIGPTVFDNTGLMCRGVIVRHLMLPGYLFDTRHILDYLVGEYGNRVYISLMNQYTPPETLIPNAPNHPLRQDHYDRMVDFLMDRSIENAYIQEGGTCSESYIPEFDLSGT